jgi:hypothetical protein
MTASDTRIRTQRPSLTARACRRLILAVGALLGGVAPVLAQPYSQLIRIDGETVFSSAFIGDLRAAEKSAGERRSVEPIVALFAKYTSDEETAELELTLGLSFSQRTGLVDHAAAVTHLTRALRFRLPEHVWLQAMVWRAGSLAQLRRDQEALKDSLRVLVALSYRDTSQPCPGAIDDRRPAVLPSIGAGSDSAENLQRMEDYRRYREQIDHARTFAVLRHAAVDAITRGQRVGGFTEYDIRKALADVSPDTSRSGIILTWLTSSNPFPRCGAG